MEPVEDIGEEEQFAHPENLQNQDPSFFSNGFLFVSGVFKAYGWFILIGVVVCMFLVSKIRESLSQRASWEASATHKKYDANETLRRQEAMDAARRRLQEQHENMADKYDEEQKKKEEEKRKAKIEDWNRHQEGKGYRSKVKVEDEPSTSTGKPAAKKNVYRQTDYSPLGGESGGACFRPPRRGGGTGGG